MSPSRLEDESEIKLTRVLSEALLFRRRPGTPSVGGYAAPAPVLDYEI